MRAGEPPHVIVARHNPVLTLYHQGVVELLGMLRAAGVGCFEELTDDPTFTKVSFSSIPARTHQLTQDGESWQATGDRPHFEFALDPPQYVAGIWVTYGHANNAGTPPVLQLFWKGADQEYSEKRWCADLYHPTGPGPHRALFWMGQKVSHFRLHPDTKRCSFRIHSLVLLTVQAGPTRSD